MNLPSDLQRLLPFVAVAVLAVAGLFLVVRGVGGGGSGATTDAQQLMRAAFEKSPKSGVADMSALITVEMATKGGERKPQTSRIRLAGPFVEPTSKDPFALGEVDARFSEMDGGRTHTLRMLSAGERGYMQVSGRWYELNERQARRVFNDEQTGKHEALLEDDEFNVQGWTQSPKLDGTARVDGVATDRIVGTLDVDTMLADLEIAASESDKAFWRNATKQGQVELFVGKDDGVLRKAAITGQAAAQGPGGAARITIRFDVALRDVNKPQRITAPKGALPVGAINKLSPAAFGSQADEVLGKQTKSNPGSGSSRGNGRSRQTGGSHGAGGRSDSKRSSQAYISCVQAATDAAALERCQAFLPRR
jgi:hypothetical protein